MSTVRFKKWVTIFVEKELSLTNFVELILSGKERGKNMQNFGEILKELLEENNLSNKQFSELTGINEGCLSLYIKHGKTPSVKHLITIADYFKCSTDFLLGKEEYKDNLVFKPCPPFEERIIFLENYMNYKPKDFYSKDGISKSGYFDWKGGKRQPLLDNIITLAVICNCRVDFILGRES